MRVEFEKEHIFPILSQIQSILEKRSTLPIFMNVLIKADKINKKNRDSRNKDSIRIYASDSELSFSAVLKGKVHSSGELVISGKKIFEMVREFSSDTFELRTEEDIEQKLGEQQLESSLIDQSANHAVSSGNDNFLMEKKDLQENTTVEDKKSKNYQIQVKQSHCVFYVHGLNPQDFPVFPSLTKSKKRIMSSKDLMKAIDTTLYCVSLDESRYHLTGIFLEQISPLNYRFVSTDGHRLSFVDIKGDKNQDIRNGIIIPRKGIQEIKKMLHSAIKEDLELYIEKPRILVCFNNQSLSVRLIEGEYPDYKSLLPTKKQRDVIINRERLLLAVKRISVLTSARFKGVNFTFKNNMLYMNFSHPDIGEASEELECKYDEKEITIRFNAQYILDVLNTISDDEIKISFKDQESAGLIRAKTKSDYTHLIMPMTL